MNPNVKTLPHHRLTLKDVIRDYKAGLLTTRGAIFYLVASIRKIGNPIKISVNWICQQLGIDRSSYYRAIGKLSQQNRLKISAPDEMELTIPISTTEGVPDYIFLEELSQICDSQLQDCDSQLQDRDSQLQDRDKKTSQPRQVNGSESPLSLQSLQSLSNGERETNADAPRSIGQAYKNWLTKKASSLPTPPVLLEQWIEKQAQLEANQREFLQEQKRRIETTFSAAAAPPQISESEIRLSQLATLNRMMERGERDQVEQSIARLDLSFRIEGDRVVVGGES